jgi:hypothetical protein
MQLNEIVSRLKEFQYLEPKAGSAVGVSEFFESVIKDQSSNTTSIRAMHQALMMYVKRPDVIFFLRRHGSGNREQYVNLRRGFVTRYSDGSEYVFCDNTFAMTFQSIKCAHLVLQSDDIHRLLSSRKIQCGFGQTSPEKELALYDPKGFFRPTLNTRGWYLAHVSSVGEGYQAIHFNEAVQRYFPRGERSEWMNSSKIREVKRPMSKEERSLLTAHFLRLVHPLNSFLVPNKKRLSYNRGALIGEEPELINYVRNYIKKEFAKEYEELSQFTRFVEEKPHLFSVNTISWVHQNKKVISRKHKTAKIVPPSSSQVKVSTQISMSLTDLINRVGKECFLYYYLPLKSNPAMSAKELAYYAPKSNNWTDKSIVSRASKAKAIFKLGLEQEALALIASSTVMDSEHVQLARLYLDRIEDETLDNESN